MKVLKEHDMTMYLFDPTKKRYVISEMRAWDKYPDVYTPEVCTALIRPIIHHLQWWINKYKSKKYEYKYHEINHYVLPIAKNFLSLLNIVVGLLEHDSIPDKHLINLVDTIWTSFNEHAGFFNLSLQRQRSMKQSGNRAKRQTWKGQNAADRGKRNDEIVLHYRNTKLSVNGFAEKHHAKYGLGVKQVREIIKKAPGT